MATNATAIDIISYPYNKKTILLQSDLVKSCARAVLIPLAQLQSTLMSRSRAPLNSQTQNAQGCLDRGPQLGKLQVSRRAQSPSKVVDASEERVGVQVDLARPSKCRGYTVEVDLFNVVAHDSEVGDHVLEES